jgi:hypothetical protein
MSFVSAAGGVDVAGYFAVDGSLRAIPPGPARKESEIWRRHQTEGVT